MSPSLLATLALLFLQSPNPFKSNAELGKSYLLGYKLFVSGTREQLKAPHERLVSLDAVETAQAFASRHESFVAEPGRKLILLHCTIKNPGSQPITVNSSDSLRLLVWEKELAKSFHYHSTVGKDRSRVNVRLARGESVQVIVILGAPESTPIAHLGLSYGSHGFKSTRWYDLPLLARKSTSPFSVDGFNYRDAVRLPAEAPVECDGLEFQVSKPRPLADGYAVQVQVRNRMLVPTRWGWQYGAAALITEAGMRIAYYPEIVDAATGKGWVGEIPAGETMRFEYRFHPGKAVTPAGFHLQMVGSKRSFEVGFVSP